MTVRRALGKFNGFIAEIPESKFGAAGVYPEVASSAAE